VTSRRLSDDHVAYARALDALDADVRIVLSGPLRDAREATRPEETVAAQAAATTRLGRPLTFAERSIDVVGLDRDLREGKARLTAAIEREKRRAIRDALVKGHALRINVTPEMRAALRAIFEAGRAHAQAEAARLAGPRLAEREYAAPPELPGRIEARLKQLLGGLQATAQRRLDVTVSEAGIHADLSVLARSAVGRAAMNVPGALDVAGRVVSSAMFAGVGDVFSAEAGLFGGFQYTAIMDGATCDPCASLDGTEYTSWEDAQADLPDGGPNPDCDGDGRCRCRLVPSGDTTGGGTGDEAAAPGDEPVPLLSPLVAPPDASAFYPGPEQSRIDEVIYRQTEALTGSGYSVADVETNIADAVRGAEVHTRISNDALEQVMKDGRFKTQFETGTSRGSLNNELRADAENKMFGYPTDLDPALRPYYGYLEQPGAASVTSSASQYGETVIRFNEVVARRSTFMLDDSLGPGLRSKALAVPIDNPSILAAPDPMQAIRSTDLQRISRAYPEAQIHGGVSLDDVAEVTFERQGAGTDTYWSDTLARATSDRDLLQLAISELPPESSSLPALRSRLTTAETLMEDAAAYLSPDPQLARLQAELDRRGIPWRYATH